MSLTDALNKQVANWGVLFIKLHNYHWYVKGTQFFTLHTKFEELYNEAAAHLDDLAERLLTIGGKPVATMNDFLKVASVRDAAGNETAEQMVQDIARDFTQMIGELKQGMELAEAANDEATGDLLLAIHSSLEKRVWMLNSFLGK